MKNDFVLREKRDFKYLFDNRTCYYSSFFTIFFVKNKQKHVRIAISVNKKIEKTAVKRNKIKRQIRAILKDNKHLNLPIDIVILPKKDFLSFDYQSKKIDLLRLINKISLKFYGNNYINGKKGEK